MGNFGLTNGYAQRLNIEQQESTGAKQSSYWQYVRVNENNNETYKSKQ